MAADDSSNAIDIDGNLDSDSNLHTDGDDATDNGSSKALAIPAPAVCLVRFAGDAAGGAVMGSIFGYGSALLLSLIFFYAWFHLVCGFLVFSEIYWEKKSLYCLIQYMFPGIICVLGD